MENSEGGRLFDGVVFTVIPSENITSKQKDELVEAVENSGGQYVPLRDTDNLITDLDSITHIVSMHVEFPQFNEAIRRGIYIVKPTWIAQSISKQKLSAARQHSPDPSQIFHDVILTCANLPAGDCEAIIAGAIALGGQYSGALSKLTTHIVTTDLEHEKCRLVELKRLNCKIVLPHWFDDCLKLRKKINESPYLFPNPELLRRSNELPVRSSATPQLEGATTAEPRGEPYPSPARSPSVVRQSLDALKGRKVYLSQDLQINDHLRRTLEGLIERAEGENADDVSACDIYIGHWRDGNAYLNASWAGKEVANLSWLFHVINRNTYTNPLSKLLHYPVPRGGIPGFENMKISISNYAGDARVYVENLIKLCGAEFTKTMKQDNTHLITAHTQSEKYEAAQEWNVNIINHLWLEESYAKCAVQTLTNPKYTHFPARTNLGEVTGQTSLDMRIVERIYFPRPKAGPSVAKSSPRADKTRADTASKLVVSPRKPSALSASNEINMLVDPQPEDIDEATVSTPVTEKKRRGRPSKALATPRLQDEEKENESPLVSSTGRASKLKAANSLRTQAEDIALFQKEMKRKGGVVHGRQRGDLTAEKSSPAPEPRRSKKRTSDEYDVETSGSEVSGDEQRTPARSGTKKARHDPPPVLPSVQHRMVVTGYADWQNNPHKESSHKAALRELGVQVSSECKDVDILVAPRIMRTRKFVTALAWAPRVVDTAWLDGVLEKRQYTEPPLLKDPNAEKIWNIKLIESLKRAKVNRRKLLNGWTIFVTKDVIGGFDTYNDIIRSNGGTALLYQGRTGIAMPACSPSIGEDAPEEVNQGGQDELDKIYLISGTSDPEVKLWRKFVDTAEKQNLVPRVVTSDWLLNAAMGQRIVWDKKWLLR